MSEITTRYRIPYILAAQTQKYVTHNEALRLDHLTNMHLITMTGATAPETSSEGECHVVGTGATGVWTNHEGEIAAYVDNA